MTNDPVFLDFESTAIAPLPDYPPTPVGLAVLDRTGQFQSGYMAFGHHTDNNSTFEETRQLLIRVWDSGRSVCYHNSAFDETIIKYKYGLDRLPHTRLHDTLFLAYLKEPFAQSLSLKPFCQDHLNIQPEERDELYEWIITNVPAAKKKKSTAGAYICEAPAAIVGPYAMADVKLTAALYDYTADVRETMLEPYHRELKLMPILMDNTMSGVRVDREGLDQASNQAKLDIAKCEQWLNKYFGRDNVNYNSGQQLVKLIHDKGIYRRDKAWPMSDAENPLADKDTLKEMITDPFVSSVLRHRDAIVKINGTYVEPFLEQSATTGRIYTNWNQVRGESGGTRTGRLSGKPTLQTLVSRFPKTPIPEELGHLTFPKVRSFILPDEGHVMIAADYQAQELRLFAHFEGGQLAEQYRADPHADLHTFSANMMSEKSGKVIPRDYAKTLSFGILYGAGPSKISLMLNISMDEARELISLYKGNVATGLNHINNDLMSRYNMRKPFRTVGGRLLKGENPKRINGQLMNFGFKSLNLLIQGSGADFTKEAMIRHHAMKQTSRLVLNLHDEIVISCPPEDAEREGQILSEAMTGAFKLDVPMVSDFKVGNNFSETK